MAETIVQKKLSRLIQEELSQILSQSQRGKLDAMLTVSQVKVTRDLSLAKIYVSVFPESKLEEQVNSLNGSNWEFRHALGAKIRNKVRKIPELRFYGDDSNAESIRINFLIDSLNITPAEEDEEETA
ncbi:MAG: 30S ribosome-binding factor RbfA [Bacteroidia bacterium]|nr:30S ribosome-binding factor RbfA [Bacteroidia bacterium]